MKSLPVLSLFLLCSLLCSVNLCAQDTPALITTTGEAIVYAAPDEILLDISITKEAADIVTAKRENNALSASTISYLKNQGIADQHIQTQYLSVRPVKSHRSKVVDYYTASQTIAVCIKDLSKYERIVDDLLMMGVTSIGSPRFRNTEMRTHKDKARVKAIKAAKEKAILLAESLGQSIQKAHKITEIKTNRYAQPSAYSNSTGSDASASGSDGASFAPGQIEVRATIEVSFLLN